MIQKTRAIPTVLVVDDASENIDVLVSILADEYRVTAALSGEKAMQIADSSDPPDLILLDVMMPGMGGIETCARLKSKKRTKDIPVIFVTAQEDEVNEANGFAAGGVDYITKPISPAIVRARVSTHLALFDQNRALEEKVDERTEQLTEALDLLKNSSLETTVRLSRAAEFKDDDTGAHILRMSHYSAAVARELGFSEKESDTILYAAPLHDIGKIGIPDNVLLKPGPLDDTEWNIMRRHCKIGADILAGSDSEIINSGETVAISHHEKWDGSGYPRQLSGEEIPVAGRIVAIADVFDALTSKRPYKDPFSVEKSFSIIEEGKGSHFDPAVVDAFFTIKEEILEIKERYRDEKASHIFRLVDFQKRS